MTVGGGNRRHVSRNTEDYGEIICDSAMNSFVTSLVSSSGLSWPGL